ncbi:hypothetical protein MSG28_010163 [Choristoneura fumiferana]|uniref:Uncharacterized protein n=1 Tax=Choristoneura fumiferana TaxID=7141 RepID=A0ACC0KK33_CHOFU|nr:hypothetical protein MSG28_010163 [Choristoneura fumiferana]
MKIIFYQLSLKSVPQYEPAGVIEAQYVGDHQQLRPSAAYMRLARHYELEVSLFERMIRNGVHSRRLGVQHRMRPELAALVCPHIYEDLRNHPSVEEFPPVKGLVNNLFFFTHDHPEQCDDDSSSRTNTFEGDMALRLANYLMQQGYQPQDVTILAAYSGQMFYLRKQRFLYHHLKNVKITVLDNYQGEESKIIVLSLVRNNTHDSIGFLGTENRICVALSRAREGFYMFGNIDLLKKNSPLWSNIEATLAQNGSVGKYLELICSNHNDNITKAYGPANTGIIHICADASVLEYDSFGRLFIGRVDLIVIVETIDDFLKVPEGGCLLGCKGTLPCEHPCPRVCHGYDREHTDIICTSQTCNRHVKPNLDLHENLSKFHYTVSVAGRKICEVEGHSCPLACGKECRPCGRSVEKSLPCGHSKVLACHMDPSASTVQCSIVITVTLPNCGHELNYQKVLDTLLDVRRHVRRDVRRWKSGTVTQRVTPGALRSARHVTSATCNEDYGFRSRSTRAADPACLLRATQDDAPTKTLMSGRGCGSSHKPPTYVTRSGRTTTVKIKTKHNSMLSPEQFQQFLEKISPAPTILKGSFTNCNYSYNGVKDAEVVEAFLSAVNIYKRSCDIGDRTALDELPILLKGEAGVWWLGIKNDVTSWQDFETRLRENFAPIREPYLLYSDITQEKQLQDMSTEDFVRRKRMLFSQLPKPGHTETQQLDMIYGLLRLDIRDKVPRADIKDFKDLSKAALAAEHVLMEKSNEVLSRKVKTIEPKPENKSASTRKPRCRYCKNYGHVSENCRKLAQKDNLPKLPTRTEAVTQFPSPSEPKVKCYGCGAPGVVRANCQTCHSSRHTQRQPDVEFCSVDTTTDARDRPIVYVDIGDKSGAAYLDTCAKSSIASYSLYCELRSKGYAFKELGVGITLADGVQKRQNVLVTRAPVKIYNRTVMTTLLVLPESRSNRTLLGVGFLVDAHIVLNLPQCTWHFLEEPSEEFELFQESFATFNEVNIATMMNTDDISLSPSLPEASNTENVSTRPYSPPESLETVNPSASAKKRPHITCPVNRSPILEALYRDAISSLQNYDEEDDLDEYDRALFPDQAKRKTSIASIDIQALTTFLDNNRTVFSPNGEPVKGFEHAIETGDHKPISVPPYRLSPVKTEILKKEIGNMLAENIIEPCSSPWAAPVVMVPKKDGSIRVCVDYRQLNAVTTADAYPMPRIDDLLHGAKPTPFMSTIDLRAGYWQISVKEDHRDKTAFVTPFGIYRFRRMPFGLRNAPATFQRMMDRFRITLSHIKLLIYLDDLIVMSATFEDHLRDLQDVFTKLREFNLTANREKCNFCCTRIKYLGHYITPDGLQLDPGKVSAILATPPPRNLKHLLTFVQMCSWYRRFIPGFAKVAEPLTRLTKKNATWKWEEEQTTAFAKLRELLTTSPILAQADHTKPYIIKTDASSYALGAVLVQGEGDKEHPVEYASRLLTKAERNYSTTEREALAVVWAVEKFRGYVEGGKITIMTDHQALRWLMSLKSPSGRLARWALLLQPYDITVKYIAGRTNVVADSLSRPNCEPGTQEECGLCTVVVDMPAKTKEVIREEQHKDADIVKIVQSLENTNEEEARYWSRKEGSQLVIPKQEQANIIAAYHDDSTAGHYGTDKTLDRLTKRYFWKGMRKQVETYVRNCLQCQRYKPTNQKPAGLLQTMAQNQRFEVVAFDLFGPLPRTADNHNWIFIVEDVATRWVELFALQRATAEECAKVLLDEIILRYGTPRRFLSDNGSQFVSSVMQQLTYCLGIKHGFTPVYHPETNPCERKNRDMKTQLAILVGDNHLTWAEKLPSIRFAMNTAKSCSTGYTPAYLTFGRELRTPDDVNHDLREIVENDSFIKEVTPRLLMMANTLNRAREIQNEKEEKRKEYVDKKRQPCPDYQPGDLVLVNTHVLSKANQGFSAKLAPRRDGPYTIHYFDTDPKVLPYQNPRFQLEREAGQRNKKTVRKQLRLLLGHVEDHQLEHVEKQCSKKLEDVRCTKDCQNNRLDCGHVCRRKCHVKDDPEHKRYTCMQQCPKPKKGCTANLEDDPGAHKCLRSCFEPCINCNVQVVKKRSSCKHKSKVECHKNVDATPCREKCARSLPCTHFCKKLCFEKCGDCKQKVKKIIPECGHEIEIDCGIVPTREHCMRKCERVMACGHVCPGRCDQPCDKSKCTKIMERNFDSPCGHEVQLPCDVLRSMRNGCASHTGAAVLGAPAAALCHT